MPHCPEKVKLIMNHRVWLSKPKKLYCYLLNLLYVTVNKVEEIRGCTPPLSSRGRVYLLVSFGNCQISTEYENTKRFE